MVLLNKVNSSMLGYVCKNCYSWGVILPLSKVYTNCLQCKQCRTAHNMFNITHQCCHTQFVSHTHVAKRPYMVLVQQVM